LDLRSVAAWLADFSIRLIWISELCSRWIIVSRDVVERGIDSGPQWPSRGILVKERVWRVAGS
jgi:hypothetical protein